jgi:cell division topological specificity factor
MRRLFELLFPPRSESAAIARERLKIVLAHERVNRDGPDFLPALQQELLDVVSRYIEIRPDMIRINLDKSGETSLLEINVEIDGAKAKPEAAAAKPPIVAELEPAKSG